ncbi:MAG: DUF6786 family protein [Verrucomicrobiota bacterium]
MLRLLIAYALSVGSALAAEFKDDVKLVADGITLSLDAEPGQVLVSPRFQGTVMVSTLDGESLGWINRDKVRTGKGGVGGADRFWFAPDGSRYTVFFDPQVPLEEKNWRPPPEVLNGPMKVLDKSEREVVMEKDIRLTNHPGTAFSTRLKRKVRILDAKTSTANLGMSWPGELNYVGFRVENEVTNLGNAWKAEDGLLSLWSLSTFQGGESVEVRMRLPKDGTVRRYFEPFRENQLTIEKQIARFRCDGNWWSKIGLYPKDALGLMLSVDRERKLLTVVRYKAAKGKRFPRAERGDVGDPYDGDMANVYNHGMLDRSDFPAPLFYEMESASPMPELGKGESISHWHEVMHFRGEVGMLESFAAKLLKSYHDG